MSSVPSYTTAQVATALASLPVMSLVTTNANMFGPDGIYANSESKTLEVPGSFEYFNASANPLGNTSAFSSLAEISMYGGVGRDTQYLKHGMEVHFENDEGKTFLDENIFGDGYLPDGLVLRQGFNDGWAWGGANTAFIHDQWVRDALTALGTQNTPGIWVQLFVNGLYWGVYNAVADIDSDYSAYFFGGSVRTTTSTTTVPRGSRSRAGRSRPGTRCSTWHSTGTSTARGRPVPPRWPTLRLTR